MVTRWLQALPDDCVRLQVSCLDLFRSSQTVPEGLKAGAAQRWFWVAPNGSSSLLGFAQRRVGGLYQLTPVTRAFGRSRSKCEALRVKPINPDDQGSGVPRVLAALGRYNARPPRSFILAGQFFGPLGAVCVLAGCLGQAWHPSKARHNATRQESESVIESIGSK